MKKTKKQNYKKDNQVTYVIMHLETKKIFLVKQHKK